MERESHIVHSKAVKSRHKSNVNASQLIFTFLLIAIPWVPANNRARLDSKRNSFSTSNLCESFAQFGMCELRM